MTVVCTCGGDFAPLLAVGKFREQVCVFWSIAEHYNMPLLRHQIDWLARANRWPLVASEA